jgi:hypothetical protein
MREGGTMSMSMTSGGEGHTRKVHTQHGSEANFRGLHPAGRRHTAILDAQMPNAEERHTTDIHTSPGGRNTSEVNIQYGRETHSHAKHWREAYCGGPHTRHGREAHCIGPHPMRRSHAHCRSQHTVRKGGILQRSTSTTGGRTTCRCPQPAREVGILQKSTFSLER